jgi:hypothetical protein
MAAGHSSNNCRYSCNSNLIHTHLHAGTDELHLVGYNFSNDISTLTLSFHNLSTKSTEVKAVIVKSSYYKGTTFYGTGLMGNSSVNTLFPSANTHYYASDPCRIERKSVKVIYVGLVWEKGATYEITVSVGDMSFRYRPQAS